MQGQARMKCSNQARWSTEPVYLSDNPEVERYQKAIPVDERITQELVDGGLDQKMAKYVANILDHDPMAITGEDLDSKETDWFEIMHSAFWPQVDFKIPFADSDVGWRVEFRPIEVQPIAYQNASLQSSWRCYVEP